MKRHRNFRAPTLSLNAARNFLDRPRDSFDFLKDIPKTELLHEAHQMGMRFATECWQHQLACFLIAAQQQRFLFYLKQGGGKSKLYIDQVRYRKRQGHLKRAIVLVPETFHAVNWEYQIKEHGPDLTYDILLGDRTDRECMLDSNSDLCVINYAGMASLMTGRGNKGMVIDPDMAAEFALRFNMGGLDEMHRVVDIDSTYYELFRWVSAACDYFYGFTGTPHGRDPFPLFGQFLLVDEGATLGTAPDLFRSVFFHAKKDYFKGLKWTFDERLLPDLHKIIKHRSISYEANEYADMPRLLRMRVPVRMRGEMVDYYTRILDGVKEARGDYASMKNVYIRMRQCASGFLAMKADDDSRIDVEFRDNPKLDALIQYVKDHNEKILVFHEYKISAAIIEKAFAKNRITFTAVRGGLGAVEVKARYDRFLDDPACQVFLLNNKTGAESINPQYVCRRIAVYESPDDAKQRDQLERRIYRLGQKFTCIIADFTVVGSIEERIRKYNMEGQSLLYCVMNGKEKL